MPYNPPSSRPSRRKRVTRQERRVTLGLLFAAGSLVLTAAALLAYSVITAKPPKKQPVAAVTVTVTAQPRAVATVTATPRPTVTRYIAIASSGGSSGWAPVTALGTLIAAIGTFSLGIAGWRRGQSDKGAPQPDKTSISFGSDLERATAVRVENDVDP